MKWWVAATVIVITAGCTPTKHEPAPPDMSIEASSGVDESGAGMFPVWQALHVAGGLFKPEQTLRENDSEASNLDAIADEATKGLNGCGSVSFAAGTLIVDFGGEPGCMFNRARVSGSVTVMVSATPGRELETGTLHISVTFAKAVVDGVGLDGTITFATNDGTLSTVEVTKLLSGPFSLDARLLVARTPTATTIDGTVYVSTGQPRGAIGAKDLTIHPGECYATRGAIGVDTHPGNVILGFNGVTPVTGVVRVARVFPYVPNREYDAYLPRYGDCPR